MKREFRFKQVEALRGILTKLQLGYFGNADSYYNNAVCKFDGQNGKYFDRTQPPVVKSKVC